MRPGRIRLFWLLALAAAALVAPAARAANSGPPRPPATSFATATADPAALARVAWQVAELRSALAADVTQQAACGQADELAWVASARAALVAAALRVDRPQLLVVVDRNPRIQQLCIVLARPDGPWQALGGSKVSTGDTGRRNYYITPTGVFLHSPAILDYRAEGTFNENNIRGFGLKGMRVWDFGWRQAEKGWRADRERGDIRLLLHATDPDYLEPRLGRPASQGCVRVSAKMNRFLDRFGVLDASYERAARTDGRIREILPVDRDPTPLAGDALVVIDSAAPAG